MSGAGEWITVAASLLLGLAAGFVMHRSDFCMAGMLRDLFLFRSTFKLRILLLTVLTTMVLVELARQTVLISLFPFPGFGPSGLANIIGGMIFGVGMVLAGGCVAGTLYKMGSGKIVSAVAFAGLIVGSVLYAEFHPVWKSFADKMLILPGKVTLAQILGMQQGMVISVVAILMAIPLVFWWRGGKLVRSSAADGYLQPWKAGLMLALLVTLSVLIIGIPLGITTSYAKAGAWMVNLIAPWHADGLSYFKARAFDYPNRLLGIAYCGGPGPAFDAISLIQFPLIGGIIAGGFLSVRLLGEFRIHAKVPIPQYLSGFIGGVLMGLASRMAPSCNIWHILGGMPILALQSIFFVAGLLPGAWLGSRLLTGIVLKETH